MNCLLARIAIPTELTESPRKYVDDVPATEDALALARWTLAISDTAGYAVIDGQSMQTKYVVFEGQIFESRR